jgi:two-component system sensor kinase FixL
MSNRVVISTEIADDSDEAASEGDIGQTLATVCDGRTFEEALHVLVLQARMMIGAHMAGISYIPHGSFSVATHIHSFSKKYERYAKYDVMPTGRGLLGLIAKDRIAMRMTQEELESHPRWYNLSDLRDERGLEHPPIRGWLVVPIVQFSGEFLGALQLSDKYEGNFTQDDQEMLIRLGKMIQPIFELHYVNKDLQNLTARFSQTTKRLAHEITENKLKTEMLQRSQEKARSKLAELELIYAKAPLGMCLLDRDFRYLRINEKMCELDGLPPEEHLGRRICAVLPDMAAKLEPVYRKVLETNEAITNVDLAAFMPAYPGTDRRFIGNHYPLRLADGTVYALCTIVQDVTERELAAEALRVSEERFRTTIEHAPIGIATATLSGRFPRVNEKFCDFLGYTAEELLGMSVFDVTLPEDVEASASSVEQLLRTDKDKSFSIDKRYLRKDGAVVWGSTTVSLLPGGSIGPTSLVGAIVDITQRKQMETALQSSTARLNAVLETAVDGIITISDDGIITSFNAAAEKMFGYTAKEAVGKNVRILMPEPTAGRHDACIQRYLATGDAMVIGVVRELVAMRADGSTFPIELSVSDMRAAGEPEFNGIVRDITDRKQAEEWLRSRTSELTHLARLSTLGEMASSIAHELNQPLGAISNYASNSVCLLQSGDIDGARQDAQETVNLAHRCSNVIKRIREFAKKRDLQRTSVNLDTVVREALAFVRRDIAFSEIELCYEQPREKLVSFVDSIQMQQVLVNLFRNSIDALQEVKPEQRILTITARASGETDVEVCVHDTGSGIPSEIADQVFSPFYSTKEEGLGMGLPICRSIVETHGGTLTITVPSQGGTLCRIVLPVQSNGTNNA